MDNKEKKRVKSLYELYGIAKFGINPLKFNEIDGNLNNQIKNSYNLIYNNKLITQNNGYYIISFIIITVFLIIYSREFVYNFFEYAKNDWDNYKCDPRIMPYSGYIKKNENSTEFMSTEENFNECIEPIAEYYAKKKFSPFENVVSFDLTSLTETMNSSITDIQASMNNLKDISSGILSMISTKENDKNNEASKVQNETLGAMLTTNALFKSISDLMLATNISIQATLTYIYNFFEGALVLIALLMVPFMVAGAGCIYAGTICGIAGTILLTNPFTVAFGPPVLAQMPILTALGFVFIAVAAAFFCLFLAIVIVMLMYAGFLKEVFNVNVQSRKTKTPNSPT
tara:strand:+ start:144 stop:1169 length:1026 start_codon:yes stop_codon:yes gene_type:complete